MRDQERRIVSSALSLVASANENQPPLRRVLPTTAKKIVKRSLELTQSLPFSLREHAALRDVSDFISLAQKDKSSFRRARNTDLLPIAHPRSTKAHTLSLDSLYTYRSRWYASDPDILSDEARTLVASAYASLPGSVEHTYYSSRLQALPEGTVPLDVLLASIFGGGNSRAARSARARAQRRDRKGRFAWMGGGLSFFIRMPGGGGVRRLSGRLVAQGVGPDDDTFDIETDDGTLYRGEARAGEAVKAFVPAVGSEGGFSPVTTDDDPDAYSMEYANLRRIEAPNGFYKDENYDGPGERFTDDAYEVIKIDPNDDDQFDMIPEYLLRRDEQGRPLLDYDKPVLIARRKDSDSTDNGYQSWADVQDWIKADEVNLDEKEGRAPDALARLTSEQYDDLVENVGEGDPYEYAREKFGVERQEDREDDEAEADLDEASEEDRFDFVNVPDDAYVIDLYEDFVPGENPDAESDEYTEDPGELASIFDEDELRNALFEAISPSDAGPATGRGNLEFGDGEVDSVPAEALYQALRSSMGEEEAEYDLADMYDNMAGGSDNRNALDQFYGRGEPEDEAEGEEESQAEIPEQESEEDSRVDEEEVSEGLQKIPTTDANQVIFDSFIRDADRALAEAGKTADEVSDPELANLIYDMRARELAEEFPELSSGEFPKIYQRDDGSWYMDTTNNQVMDAYLGKYYPGISGDTEIFIYRGTNADESLGDADSRWWTYDPAIAAGYANVYNGRVAVLKTTPNEIVDFNNFANPRFIGPTRAAGNAGFQHELNVDWNRVPETARGTLEYVDAPEVAVGARERGSAVYEQMKELTRGREDSREGEEVSEAEPDTAPAPTPEAEPSPEPTPEVVPDAEPTPEEAPTPEAELPEARPLPALLDGLSDDEKAEYERTGDYKPYLPKNEDFDVPEGFYSPDPDPFENVDENPDVDPINLAENNDTETLTEALTNAVSPDAQVPGNGIIEREDSDGEMEGVSVPAEALRDALQLQGEDTNEILERAFSQEQEEEREEEEPAAEIPGDGGGEEPPAEPGDVGPEEPEESREPEPTPERPTPVEPRREDVASQEGSGFYTRGADGNLDESLEYREDYVDYLFDTDVEELSLDELSDLINVIDQMSDREKKRQRRVRREAQDELQRRANEGRTGPQSKFVGGKFIDDPSRARIDVEGRAPEGRESLNERIGELNRTLDEVRKEDPESAELPTIRREIRDLLRQMDEMDAEISRREGTEPRTNNEGDVIRDPEPEEKRPGTITENNEVVNEEGEVFPDTDNNDGKEPSDPESNETPDELPNQSEQDSLDEEFLFNDEEFPPTEQQKDIVRAFLTGKNIVVRALAGTGKTSTLKLMARALKKISPDKKILYVAFNKSVQQDAQKSMPDNVEARTDSSLAYRWARKALINKLSYNRGKRKDLIRRPKDIANEFNIQPRRLDGDDKSAAEVASIINKAIDNYAISDDDELGWKHFPLNEESFSQDLVDKANEIWADINSDNGRVEITQNHLTKMWALSRPDLRKDLGVDIIFFDEAQDINPVLAKIIADQELQKVYVGDENQAIYGFRGAVDQLGRVFVEFDLPLTKSWRFGPQIAGVANRFLTLLGAQHRVEGGGPDGEIVRDVMTDADAVVVRTNAGAIAEILRELNNGRRVGVSKQYKAELASLVETAEWLKGGGDFRNRPNKVHPDLAGFKNWSEVREAAEDRELNQKVSMLYRMVEDNGIEELKSVVDRAIGVDAKRGKDDSVDVVITTAHKAKGLEWDRVRIGGDFWGPKRNKETGEVILPSEEELRIAYVAVTRAQKALDPGALEWIFDHTKDSDESHTRDALQRTASTVDSQPTLARNREEMDRRADALRPFAEYGSQFNRGIKENLDKYDRFIDQPGREAEAQYWLEEAEKDLRIAEERRRARQEVVNQEDGKTYEVDVVRETTDEDEKNIVVRDEDGNEGTITSVPNNADAVSVADAVADGIEDGELLGKDLADEIKEQQEFDQQLEPAPAAGETTAKKRRRISRNEKKKAANGRDNATPKIPILDRLVGMKRIPKRDLKGGDFRDLGVARSMLKKFVAGWYSRGNVMPRPVHRIVSRDARDAEDNKYRDKNGNIVREGDIVVHGRVGELVNPEYEAVNLIRGRVVKRTSYERDGVVYPGGLYVEVIEADDPEWIGRDDFFYVAKQGYIVEQPDLRDQVLEEDRRRQRSREEIFEQSLWALTDKGVYVSYFAAIEAGDTELERIAANELAVRNRLVPRDFAQYLALVENDALDFIPDWIGDGDGTHGQIAKRLVELERRRRADGGNIGKGAEKEDSVQPKRDDFEDIFAPDSLETGTVERADTRPRPVRRQDDDTTPPSEPPAAPAPEPTPEPSEGPQAPEAPEAPTPEPSAEGAPEEPEIPELPEARRIENIRDVKNRMRDLYTRIQDRDKPDLERLDISEGAYDNAMNNLREYLNPDGVDRRRDRGVNIDLENAAQVASALGWFDVLRDIEALRSRVEEVPVRDLGDNFPEKVDNFANEAFGGVADIKAEAREIQANPDKNAPMGFKWQVENHLRRVKSKLKGLAINPDPYNPKYRSAFRGLREDIDLLKDVIENMGLDAEDMQSLTEKLNNIDSLMSDLGELPDIPTPKVDAGPAFNVVEGAAKQFQGMSWDDIRRATEVGDWVYDNDISSGINQVFVFKNKNTDQYIVVKYDEDKYYRVNGEFIGAGAQAEELAAILYRDLGFAMPAAARPNRGSDAGENKGVVVMEFAEDGFFGLNNIQVAGYVIGRGGNPLYDLDAVAPEYKREVLEFMVANGIIGNTDRHPGNFMFGQDADGKYRLVPIDNGLAFFNGAFGDAHRNKNNPLFLRPDNVISGGYGNENHMYRVGQQYIDEIGLPQAIDEIREFAERMRERADILQALDPEAADYIRARAEWVRDNATDYARAIRKI